MHQQPEKLLALLLVETPHLLQLSKNYLHAMAFEVALDHAEVRDVSGQAVNVINENNAVEFFGGIVAQPAKLWAGEQAAAPAIVFADAGDLPAFFGCESLKLGDLGVNCLAFALFFSRDAGIQGSPDRLSMIE